MVVAAGDRRDVGSHAGKATKKALRSGGIKAARRRQRSIALPAVVQPAVVDGTSADIAEAGKASLAAKAIAAAARPRLGGGLASASALNVKKDARRRRSTLTSLNMSIARRSELRVMELQHHESVVSNPTFQADPMEAVRRHLETTARFLPQHTADIGRPPLDGASRKGGTIARRPVNGR